MGINLTYCEKNRISAVAAVGRVLLAIYLSTIYINKKVGGIVYTLHPLFICYLQQNYIQVN